MVVNKSKSVSKVKPSDYAVVDHIDRVVDVERVDDQDKMPFEALVVLELVLW
jgi:hypothetical protein